MNRRGFVFAVLLLTACQGTAREDVTPMVLEDDFTATRTGEREVTLRRTFAAAPASVFEAMTTPELLREWLSAAGRELTVCEVDLREGGTYRYVFSLGDDREFGMRGTYREVVPVERIVSTEAYDGYDWEPLVVTTRFRGEAGPRTRVEVTVVYPSEEICERDFPNLEQSRGVYERLAALLADRDQEEGDGG